MPISKSLKKSTLLTGGLHHNATVSLLVLTCFSAAALAVSAKDAPQAEGAKPAVKPTAEAPEKAARGKSTASLSDPPVGAKTTAELVKKLSDAYRSKDAVAYLSILKAPMRERIRLHLHFRRDCSNPLFNFKFVTIAEEAARIKAPQDTVGKRTTVNGVEEDYQLPVVGFIDYESHKNLQGPPDVMSVAVCKGKDAYFIETRLAVEGGAKTTAAPAPTTGKAPAPVKAH